MIMTALQEWNMKTMNTRTSITVKNISKTKAIQKAKIMKVMIKMNI